MMKVYAENTIEVTETAEMLVFSKKSELQFEACGTCILCNKKRTIGAFLLKSKYRLINDLASAFTPPGTVTCFA